MMSRPTIVLYYVLSATLLVGCATPDRPEFTEEEPRAFVSTLGTDTLNVEIYTKSDDVLEGVYVGRSPQTYVIDYSVRFGIDGTIDYLEASRRTPEPLEPSESDYEWAISISDTSATIEQSHPDRPRSQTVSAPDDAIPTLGRISAAMFVFQQVANQLKGPDAPDGPVYLVSPSARRAFPYDATVVAADTVTMDFFGSPRVAWLNSDGLILGASGNQTTVKTETRRVPIGELQIDDLAHRWAAMDVGGIGMGSPSPAATATGRADGATIEIRYSRPAVRGRQIWGGLVPYDQVWRTGANAATHFTTDTPISFGALELSAGTYTLWTTFTPDSGTLIVNEQTGQWGTQYDSSRDLGRIPMTRVELDEPVERFTISVEDAQTGGKLRLAWNSVRWEAPFSVQ